MEEIILNVEARSDRGKGAARRLRRSGKVPAVFYGPKSDAMPIAVDRKDFAAHVANLEGSHLIRFQSASSDLQQRVALVREVQHHPVTSGILHVDFYEVDLTQRLKVTVPLHFVGRARGVAEGGILQPVIREIEVECLPTDIPQFIEVDVTALDIHDAVHYADVTMPPNVTAVFDANEAVVTVLPPTVEEVKTATTEGEGESAAAATPPEAKETKESGKS
ncbi:MAG: 50S ribosomal protein L25 [Deltaproteobacteria bacterium]|nr:50S ribosomal protein L25 [Deltaproteobacteria bacterium]